MDKAEVIISSKDLDRISTYLDKGEGDIDDILMNICEQGSEKCEFYCHKCSVDGGAGIPIYHLQPICTIK